MKYQTWVPVTNEVLTDGPFVGEAIAVAAVTGRAVTRTRYRHVFKAGYREALEDIRSGRLVLKDGFFRQGDAA